MNLRRIIYVAKIVWNDWDIRAFMLMSFFFQISLVLVAPLRTRSSSNCLRGILFCLYLLADWAASYASGVIFNSRDDAKHKDQLLPFALWLAFLLVHLGGADSITAFTFQDNDFWHRHAICMTFQCTTSIYIFFVTLQHNNLWIPTILVFISGFIKYLERIMSLYSASFDNLRHSLLKAPDPGPCYLRGDGYLRISSDLMTLYARHFFQTIKLLVVDLKCSYDKSKESREFFLCLTPEQAFEVIALELNFLYEILFTKAIVLETRKGLFRRLLSFVLMVCSIALFYYEDKETRQFDVAISYALLLGSILFDLKAFHYIIMDNYFASPKKLLISNPSHQPPPCKKHCFGPIGKFIKFLKRSWTESVSTLGLIEYCLPPRPCERRKILDCVGVTRYFDGCNYVKSKPFTEGLKKLIFREVKCKAPLAVVDLSTLKKARKARGDWTIGSKPNCSGLLHYVNGKDYEYSLLTWHIATELCWYQDEGEGEDKGEGHREHAKVLSDYMMYLVKIHPSIMYGVTDIGQTRLRDTCAEIERVFGTREKEPNALKILYYAFKCLGKGLIIFIIWTFSPALSIALSLCVLIFGNSGKPKQWKMKMKRLVGIDDKDEANKKTRIEFCRKILGVGPVCIQRDGSKSVLLDGYLLANEMMKLEDGKWEIMSRVWVEMLCYAAGHCRPHMLARPLSSGGELVSFVWVLMAHFGLVDQFEVDGSIRGQV